MRVRRNDLVQIITGDDAGPQSRRVLQVLEGGQRVVVEGSNRVYKHVRRGHPKSPQGGRLSLEMPIQISNVMPWCGSCNRGVRVGVRYQDDGSKERFCKKCGGSLGVISKPRPRYAKTR